MNAPRRTQETQLRSGRYDLPRLFQHKIYVISVLLESTQELNIDLFLFTSNYMHSVKSRSTLKSTKE